MYQDFIASSRGEISAAKQVYVELRTGWFSCRSAGYLASGRPVVVQDTGFTPLIASGEGIIAFKTVEEAALGLMEVEGEYDRHAEAALELARQYFDSSKVLKKLIDDVYS